MKQAVCNTSIRLLCRRSFFLPNQGQYSRGGDSLRSGVCALPQTNICIFTFYGSSRWQNIDAPGGRLMLSAPDATSGGSLRVTTLHGRLALDSTEICTNISWSAAAA